MNWKYVKPLKSEKLISDFESLVNYEFPTEFRNCVMQYNGGRPERKRFDTNMNTERELKLFLSFNTDDRETVWKIYEWNKKELYNKFAVFAIDNFGNLICFDTNNDNVIFLNYEDLSVEYITNKFADFLELLYE